ncbi:hypothetical protein AGMMS49975_27720 [Clostridia bacterium]|nr:hypothetical protein AGMMS49975_27720 [Clostridia bacterium]
MKSHFIGGSVPIGYKINPDKEYEIDEETASIIQGIFTDYVNGKRNIDIADTLNKAGLRGRLGNKFNSAHIHEIIINEKYIGTYKSIHIRVEDAIPAIIDKKLWERAQTKMQENKKRSGAANAEGLWAATVQGNQMEISTHTTVANADRIIKIVTKKYQDFRHRKTGFRRNTKDIHR